MVSCSEIVFLLLLFIFIWSACCIARRTHLNSSSGVSHFTFSHCFAAALDASMRYTLSFLLQRRTVLFACLAETVSLRHTLPLSLVLHPSAFWLVADVACPDRGRIDKPEYSAADGALFIPAESCSVAL